MKIHAFLLLTLLCAAPLIGQGVGDPPEKSASTATNDQYDRLSVNDITMWLSNNGSMSHNPYTDASGFEWPKNSAKCMIFHEGFIVGGMVNGEIRIGGSAYTQGLQAGPIRASGFAANPNDPRYRIYRVRKLSISELQMLSFAEQTQLERDFNEWPVADGAPWIDVDNDGQFRPDFYAWIEGDTSHDTPAFPGDEVIWFVSNDLDGSRTKNLYGTNPMGLEFQVLAWASHGDDIDDRTVYVQYTLINKSPNTIDQMTIARWVDPDLGDASDDLVGVDTTLGMMYCYNDELSDGIYGTAPPALGIVWLQTPIAPSPGGKARYGDGWREGYRNIQPSSFAFYINSDPVYQDPDLGSAQGAEQMFNYMRGKLYDGSNFVDPNTGRSVRFPLAGNPLTRNGWVDGMLHEPDDRRMLYSAGPFTLAPGDTQMVVMATTVGMGITPVLALEDAKRNVRLIKHRYSTGVRELNLDDFAYTLTWPARDSFTLRISASHDPYHQTIALLRDAGSAELLRIPLHDDGQHGDGDKDDGVYAAECTHAALKSGGDLFIALLDANEILAEVPIASMLPLVGEVRVDGMTVLSDHLDFNRETAPGENIIYGFDLVNNSTSDLGSWSIVTTRPSGDITLVRIPRSVAAADSYQLNGLNSGFETLALDVPESTQPGSSLRIPVILRSDQYCLWNDTLTLSVHALSRPVFSGLLTHVSGPAKGALGYTVDNPANLDGHVLRVTVEGEDLGTKTLTVEDVTEGRILQSGVPVSDQYGHRSPSIAGIRLHIGTAIADIDTTRQGAALPEPVLWNFENEQRSWFAPYADMLIYGFQFFGSSLSIFDTYPVALVFDRSNLQRAYSYLLRDATDYGYHGYYESPVRAYDMRDTTNPRQINLGFVERNGSAAQDNRWYPSSNASDYEYLCVFADDYSDTPKPAYTQPLHLQAWKLPMLYMLWPKLLPSNPTFENGDRFWMLPQVPISQRDVYMLDASTLGGIEVMPSVPASVALYPNYPNPFTSATSIAYRLDHAGYAELVLHDMLGRKVRTLVAEHTNPGTHVYRLALGDAPPGVYFCRLTAGGQTVARRLVLQR